jgi:F5/8 type C domain
VGGVAAFLNGRLIQYSTDNATWTTVATIAGVNDTGTLFNFDFTAVSARYWRLSSTAWLSTTEMRVYEGAVGALNSRVRVRVESVRGGLASMQSHDYTVPRV